MSNYSHITEVMKGVEVVGRAKPTRYTATHFDGRSVNHSGTFRDFCTLHGFPYHTLKTQGSTAFTVGYNWEGWQFTKEN